MAYNRNYYGSRNSYSNGYNNNGYGARYAGGARQQVKKMSGARFGVDKNGHPYVVGWRKRGRLYQTLSAFAYSGTRTVTSDRGKKWANLFVKITSPDTGEIVKTSGILDVDGKRLYIRDLNLIATSKGNGGYFGKHISKTYK